MQWENNASARFADTHNRYTTRNRGTDVVFKIVVMRPSKDSSYTTIRLVDQELWHGTDPNTPKWWFDGRVHDPYTFELVYQTVNDITLHSMIVLQALNSTDVSCNCSTVALAQH